MKIKYPNIDYKYWLSNWDESTGKGKVFTDKNIVKYIKLDKDMDINACESEIIKLTTSNEKLSKSKILRVVDLIYSWGGKSGRGFYIKEFHDKAKNRISAREELESNDNTFKKYLEGIDLAKKGKTESLEKFKKIRGIGNSFGTKHSYFWSINSIYPLIVIDSKIAGALGYKTIDLLEKNFDYQKILKSFVDKTELEFQEKNPIKVERALFAFHNFYFLNDNSNWAQGLDIEYARKNRNKNGTG